MIRRLCESVLHLIQAHKELRYVLSGGLSVVIEYISFLLLILFTPLLVANSISFVIGIGSGFVFHKLWSFAGNHSLKTAHQVLAYCLVAAFNFLATNFIISFLVYSISLAPALAKIITMAVVAAWTYVLFNKLVFRSES